MSLIRKRRRELGHGLADVERALAAPAGSPDWSLGVSRALGELHDLAIIQYEDAMGEGGLLEDIVTRRPGLSDRAERVKESLTAVMSDLETLISAVPSLPVPEARDHAVPFLGRAARIRQEIGDLVWEAYWVDVGGPG